MLKHNAKGISNLIKIIIVFFIFYNYMFQSKIAGHPLSADECKGLLFIAIAGFMILLPIDSSIFIKNLKSINIKDKENNEEENEEKDDENT
ncbi:hypothetical protein [Brachyspira sp.]|uniref:hypothetical protein n=1 Tax=Brachyspira sp. TaxID=1977261 RepID=UPI003D7EBD87